MTLYLFAPFLYHTSNGNVSKTNWPPQTAHLSHYSFIVCPRYSNTHFKTMKKWMCLCEKFYADLINYIDTIFSDVFEKTFQASTTITVTMNLSSSYYFIVSLLRFFPTIPIYCHPHPWNEENKEMEREFTITYKSLSLPNPERCVPIDDDTNLSLHCFSFSYHHFSPL